MDSSALNTNHPVELLSLVDDQDIKIDWSRTTKAQRQKSVLERLHITEFQLGKHCISVNDDKQNYTPMQYGATYGLINIVKVLLEAKIDPNYAGEDRETKLKKKLPFNKFTGSRVTRREGTPNTKSQVQPSNDCKMHPLLLAAKNGHHEIIKIFKYHMFFPETIYTSEDNTNDDPNGDVSEKLTTLPNLPKNVDFAVLNNPGKKSIIKQETVLHLVLKQPLLEIETSKEKTRKFSERKFSEKKFSHIGSNMKKAEKKHNVLHDIHEKYRKCINVLLDVDRFENEIRQQDYYDTIRSIVNKQDGQGNTPLHFAVSNWSEDVVKKLLNLGANASIKNKGRDIPLTRISKSAFEDFLNKQCIIVKDYDPSDDEIEEESDEDEATKKIVQDYNPAFMMKISQCGKEENNEMTFDYAFLAPPDITKSRQKKNLPLTQVETVFARRSNSLEEDTRSNHPDVEKQTTEKNENCSLSYKPEMDLLLEMSQSSEHRSLIIHPVIDSYLWMKWKLMTKFFNRNLRLDFLFCYCVIWHIFAQFGGQKWNAIILSQATTHEQENKTQFCESPSYQFKLMDFSSIELLAFSMFWYYWFIFIFIIQLSLMLRDLRRDIGMRWSTNYEKSSQSPIVGSWIDGVNLVLSFLTILGGQDILWLIITLLLIFYIVTELGQMSTVHVKYFTEVSNWIDLGIIILIFVILYVPHTFVVNPHIFSIFDTKSDSNQSDEMGNCRIKRCISAIVIVLVSVRYLMSISKLPSLKNYNLYVIMFFKVMTVYLKIMIWYSCYLIAFGLGFYIMLHNDTKKTKTKEGGDSGNKSSICDNSEKGNDKNKFGNPYLALIKTSTMFVGEIEFGDLPITGGDISVTMIYIFLILFIFVMIIVLMNLLNGLAVSDTGKMINDSLIESQISFITTISYFESVYIGQMQRITFDDENSSRLKTFFHTHFVPKGILLFHSPYLRDEGMTKGQRLTLPLKIQEPTLQCQEGFCFYKLVNWFFKDDENVGSEEFLDEARKILIHERSCKVKERREEAKKKRKKEMNTTIKSMKSNIEFLRNNSYISN